MLLTRTSTRRALRWLSIILIIGIISAYAVWRSFDYARGPKIDIFEPLDGSSVASSTAVVRGRAERVTGLSLNGRIITVDEQGNWNETLVIFPGINTITFNASDQFGRNVTRELQLFGLNR